MKKQHRKCSGVDLTFFDPVGAFPKSGGGPNYPYMRQNGKSKISMKTSLLDQFLPGVHRGGVGECHIFCPEKKIKTDATRAFFHFGGKMTSGPENQISDRIIKYPKSPNPTLQPCWVHPTKSQNSLQEVDSQLNTKLK